MTANKKWTILLSAILVLISGCGKKAESNASHPQQLAPGDESLIQTEEQQVASEEMETGEAIAESLAAVEAQQVPQVSENVQLVKSGILNQFNSTTIGQALDNYSSFSSVEWRDSTTANGRQFVIFKGMMPFPPNTPTSITEVYVKDSRALIALFQINVGGQFQVSRIYTYMEYNDGRKPFEFDKNIGGMLKNIYNNVEFSAYY